MSLLVDVIATSRPDWVELVHLIITSHKKSRPNGWVCLVTSVWSLRIGSIPVARLGVGLLLPCEVGEPRPNLLTMNEQPKNKGRMPKLMELYVREAAKTNPQYQVIVDRLDRQKEERE